MTLSQISHVASDFDRDRVYVVYRDNPVVTAVSISEGTVLWQKELGGLPSEDVPDQNRIRVNKTSGSVYVVETPAPELEALEVNMVSNDGSAFNWASLDITDTYFDLDAILPDGGLYDFTFTGGGVGHPTTQTGLIGFKMPADAVTVTMNVSILGEADTFDQPMGYSIYKITPDFEANTFTISVSALIVPGSGFTEPGTKVFNIDSASFSAGDWVIPSIGAVSGITTPVEGGITLVGVAAI